MYGLYIYILWALFDFYKCFLIFFTCLLKNVYLYVFKKKHFILFILYWGKSINNVVVVSSEQQRDSTIHIRQSILPQTPLPSRLAHNIE